MKKYFNSENLLALAIVVVGVWVGMATYGKVAGWFKQAKDKAGA